MCDSLVTRVATVGSHVGVGIDEGVVGGVAGSDGRAWARARELVGVGAIRGVFREFGARSAFVSWQCLVWCAQAYEQVGERIQASESEMLDAAVGLCRDTGGHVGTYDTLEKLLLRRGSEQCTIGYDKVSDGAAVDSESGSVSVVDVRRTGNFDHDSAAEVDGVLGGRSETFYAPTSRRGVFCAKLEDGNVGQCSDGSGDVGDLGRRRSVGQLNDFAPGRLRGPKGGLSRGRGPNYERNQLRRMRKKDAVGGNKVEDVEEKDKGSVALKLCVSGSFNGDQNDAGVNVGGPLGGWKSKDRKNSGRRFLSENWRSVPTEAKCSESDGVDAVADELRDTWRERRIVENKLKTFQMRRQLELVEGQDLAVLRERNRTKILRDTEVNKVQIEKAFASLAAADNVPSMVGGSAKTVSSGSISPNSSASEAEVRKIQKDLLDAENHIAELKVALDQNDLIGARNLLKDKNIGKAVTSYTVEDGVPVAFADQDIGGYHCSDGRFRLHSWYGDAFEE